MPEPFCEIDGDDFVEALSDPKVHEMWRRANEYAADLIARGHCKCHLVINCPNEGEGR